MKMERIRCPVPTEQQWRKGFRNLNLLTKVSETIFVIRILFNESLLSSNKANAITFILCEYGMPKNSWQCCISCFLIKVKCMSHLTFS